MVSFPIDSKAVLRAKGCFTMQMRVCLLIFFVCVFAASVAYAGAAWRDAGARGDRRAFVVTVVDETGIAVESALVTLSRPGSEPLARENTDVAGRCEFAGLEPGDYAVTIEKEGFYLARLAEVHVGDGGTAEVTLYHEQELKESVDVSASPPAIDPAQTAATQTLTGQEINNIPYPSTRDYRNVLPFLPGVVQDPSGQPHVHGGATFQTYTALDGFDVSDPTDGALRLRLSVDALRSVQVQGSRTSAEFGRGSAGVLDLTSGMGDDHYRFSATDFTPSFRHDRGYHIDDWTPRATISGPLAKGRAWFFDAADAEYSLKVFPELPEGADRASAWRWSNLAKAQINLSQTNILTAELLVDHFHSGNFGLSRFNPTETTLDVGQSIALATVRDQTFLANGAVLDVGFGASRFHDDEQPLGTLLYLIRPEGTSGNYFKISDGLARRFESFATFHTPRLGAHQLSFGTNVERVTYDQDLALRPIRIEREDATLAREITFVGPPHVGRDDTLASAFAQDRWSPNERLLVEAGVRADWDQILHQTVVSSRLAGTYMLTRDARTKLSAGIGVYYDRTNLDFITRAQLGERVDEFFAPDGETPVATVRTQFEVDERALRAPRFVNCSVALERLLPGSVYLDAEYIQRRGKNGFVFEPGADGALVLTNGRRDSYDALEVTVRHTFGSTYSVLASYTRSAARSNAVVDYSFDSPVFGPQAGGPLPWDAPNRFLSWGTAPLVKGFDLAYSVDWRNGYPYSLVGEEQRLVGAPNSSRLPAYFSLNLHIERQFRLFGYHWSLRAGSNDVTNRQNPSGVNNNVDSPQFLTYGGVQHRVFTARIRFLGKK
jgi:hypothetical protein